MNLKIKTLNQWRGYSKEWAVLNEAAVLDMLESAGIEGSFQLKITGPAHFTRNTKPFGKIVVRGLSKTGENFQLATQVSRNGSQALCSLSDTNGGKMNEVHEKLTQAFKGTYDMSKQTEKKSSSKRRSVPIGTASRKTVSKKTATETSEIGKIGGRGFFKKEGNRNWLLSLIKTSKGQKKKFITSDVVGWIKKATGQDVHPVGMGKTLQGFANSGHLSSAKPVGKGVQRRSAYTLPPANAPSLAPAKKVSATSRVRATSSVSSGPPPPPQSLPGMGQNDDAVISGVKVMADIYEGCEAIDAHFSNLEELARKLSDLNGDNGHEVYARVKEDPRFAEAAAALQNIRSIVAG